MGKPKKLKLPKRTDGGCIMTPYSIVCKPTTTGILNKSQRRMTGRGSVEIPAHIARCIIGFIEELPKGCPIVYQDEIAEMVSNQLCSWCDGLGWQGVNCYEDIVACSNCEGCGLEPEKNRMKLSKITSLARERMDKVLDWRKEGKTLEWIGRQLKVTKERVRQIQKLAENLQKLRAEKK